MRSMTTGAICPMRCLVLNYLHSLALFLTRIHTHTHTHTHTSCTHTHTHTLERTHILIIQLGTNRGTISNVPTLAIMYLCTHVQAVHVSGVPVTSMSSSKTESDSHHARSTDRSATTTTSEHTGKNSGGGGGGSSSQGNGVSGGGGSSSRKTGAEVEQMPSLNNGLPPGWQKGYDSMHRSYVHTTRAHTHTHTHAHTHRYIYICI